MFKLLFTLTQKFEFLPTAFAIILTPVALPVVPRVEFNFEVIMYITILVSKVRKAALNLFFRQNLLESFDLHVFAAVVGTKPSSPESSEDSVLNDPPF